MTRPTKADAREFTSTQWEYIGICADPGERRKQEEIATALQVDRSTLWSWRKIAGFWEEVNRIRHDATNLRMSRVWDALLNQCELGNVKAMKLLFQLRGELVERREDKLSIEGIEELAQSAKRQIKETLGRMEGRAGKMSGNSAGTGSGEG